MVSTEETPKKGSNETGTSKVKRGSLGCEEAIRDSGYQKKFSSIKTETPNSISEGIQKKRTMNDVSPAGTRYDEAYKKRGSSKVFTLIKGITLMAKITYKLKTEVKSSYYPKAEYVVLVDGLKRNTQLF